MAAPGWPTNTLDIVKFHYLNSSAEIFLFRKWLNILFFMYFIAQGTATEFKMENIVFLKINILAEQICINTMTKLDDLE